MPFALALVGAIHSTSEAGLVLSDNASAARAGTETASGTGWLASSFGTDASSYALNSVTLLVQGDVAGSSVEVDLYGDVGQMPGTSLGMLTPSGPLTIGSPSAVTFAAGGLTLAADSTCWVVVKPPGGSVDWSWTSDDAGTGAGFQDQWGETSDSGSDWFTYDSSPTQMTVVATPASVPEPGSALLLGAGLATSIALGLRRKGRRASA